MKIRANVRGDSGLSDSQFQRSQKHILNKHAKEMASMNEWAEKERLKKRYDSQAKAPARGLWSKIVRFFTGK